MFIIIQSFLAIFTIIINFFIGSVIIKLMLNYFKRKNINNYFKNNVITYNKSELKGSNLSKFIKVYNDVSKRELEKFNTDDIDSLKNYFYEKFVQFENAYNNLDYSMMKILSTKQMFNNYYTGITLDLKVGKKRIISDIEKKKVVLFELDSTMVKQIASLMIEISYINYTIDKNGTVIRGSRDTKITEKFEVTFRKDFEVKEITDCPNCGAEIIGNKCDFCRTIVKNVDFKISSIKKIVIE